MSEARQQALEALYEADVADLGGVDLGVLSSKARRLVAGVLEHLVDIDAAVEQASINWKVARMPAVDRALLRLGAYELGHTDTPMAVVISEIVELAKNFSTERSGAFVNGVLSTLAEQRDR